MGKACSILGAGLLLLSLLALPMRSDAAADAPETSPAVEIRTQSAVVAKERWFRVNLHCVAPEGSVCSGSISVRRADIRPGAGHTLPLAVRHSYNLTAGAARALAIRLKPYAASSLETEGAVNAVLLVFVRYGDSARGNIVLRRNK